MSQYYSPEPVSIPASLARELAARGHQVRVVTGFPNYPGGSLYAGYRQKLVFQENDGEVRVRRVPLILSHSKSAFGRIANYLSFAVATLLAGRFVRHSDVIYVYATPMTAAFAPSIWYKMRQIPYVMHVQDVWPESITGSSMLGSASLRRVISATLTPWLASLYASAAATITIGPTMTVDLIARGVPTDRSYTVFNWGNETADPPIEQTKRNQRPKTKTFTVAYSGNIGDLQDLETVIRAAHAVRDLEGFRLELVGVGVALARLERLVGELGATNVIFRGWVHPLQIRDHYLKSDFQIVPLRALSVFNGTIPSKLQTSLYYGVPIITTVTGDTAEIVTVNGLGFASDPEDPAALEAVFRMAFALPVFERAAMAARAKNFYRHNMSQERGTDAIERILQIASQSARKKGTP